MTSLVSPTEIESIVGIRRSKTDHYGRAYANTLEFYILHSQDCVDSINDLRDCEWSLNLDKGVSPKLWREALEKPVVLGCSSEGLVLG